MRTKIIPALIFAVVIVAPATAVAENTSLKQKILPLTCFLDNIDAGSAQLNYLFPDDCVQPDPPDTGGTPLPDSPGSQNGGPGPRQSRGGSQNQGPATGVTGQPPEFASDLPLIQPREAETKQLEESGSDTAKGLVIGGIVFGSLFLTGTLVYWLFNPASPIFPGAARRLFELINIFKR